MLPLHHPASRAVVANAALPESVKIAAMHHLRTNAECVNILAEREMVRLGGLRTFIKRAWHTVEGMTPYSSNWHIDAICDHLEAVSRGEVKRLIIAVPPRSMKPVWEEEMVVLQDRGRVQLCDVRVGDRILTHRGRFRPVAAVHDNGVLATVRLNTWGQRSVRMAPDHPVLTPVGWVPCGELTTGHSVGVVQPDFDRAIWADRVVSVTPDEPGRCICLTVEEDQSFTVGDVAVHNSVSTAVMWPAWDWVDNPQRRTMFSSYAHNLSKRDSARCRRVITSDWYQARWGDRFKLTADQNAKHRFENDKTGYRLATSVGGQLTGEGADICVVDDPLNSSDSDSLARRETMLTWWNESMSTRLNDPANGAFVIIQQRLHENDLIGDILKKHGVIEDGGEYVYLCLPAEFEPDHPNRWFRDPRKELGELLWPSHVPAKAIEGLKRALGPYSAAGQLQQRPAPREGGMFKRNWFKIEQVLPPDMEWARGWDLAASVAKVAKSDPDYTAGVLIGFSRSMRRWYVTDVQRTRDEPAEIERMIKRVADQDQADGRSVRIELPQDPGQAGKSQAAAMVQMLSGYDVRALPQSGDKATRAGPFASQAAGGNISLLKADWNEEFLVELTGFPTGAHDDMLDAAASAFTRLTGGTTGLLEYYSRMLDEQSREKAEKAAQLAANGGVLPALITIEENTADMARALILGGRNA